MQAVADFYDKHPYPAPTTFLRPTDRDFWRPHPYQDVGQWSRKVAADTRIWVLGCGVNQAIDVALRYPMAQVHATDTSPKTIERVRALAAEMSIDNLTLGVQDFDAVVGNVDGFYDLVICTGVAHHFMSINWLPRLRCFLKPDGILELMVYNEAHRWEGHRFQRLLRAYFGEQWPPSCDDATALLVRLARDGAFTALLERVQKAPVAERADMLIHPFERLYTFESLLEECRAAHMTILQPVLQQAWASGDAASTFDDYRLWTCVDYLGAPLLWFYLQRDDSPHPRVDRHQLATVRGSAHHVAAISNLEAWIDGKWQPASGTVRRTWILP